MAMSCAAASRILWRLHCFVRCDSDVVVLPAAWSEKWFAATTQMGLMAAARR
jgi:hypothetical protein